MLACLAGAGAEKHETEQREHDLGESLQGGAHRNGSDRALDLHAALAELADHEGGTAELSCGHQAVGGLADPAHQQRISPGTRLAPGAVKQHVNRGRIHP